MADDLREGNVADLREALKDLKLGDNVAKSPVIDWSLNVPVFLTIIGMAGTELVGYVQLENRVESFGRRLEIVEKRQSDNFLRYASEIEKRTARTETIGMIARLGDNVAALDKTVALIQDRQGRGGRTELPSPERDAQMQPPTSRPR